jgi:hypothetical protein
MMEHPPLPSDICRKVVLFCLVTPLMAPGSAPQGLPKTRAELTGYEETSRYEDVLGFMHGLENQSRLLRQEFFGRTSEGRNLPLVIIANPPLSEPREAQESGKLVVFIMADIHAGEVEGKEAVQTLARRLAAGDLRPMLEQMVILLAPIYNADGNERISTDNRSAQNGPVGGVGRRENAQGLDLNRDYMKLEAPESRALVRLFNRWDPYLVIDLHTSNGSHHGYHLTYSPPLNPDADARIISFERDRMLPEITEVMRRRHKFRTYYYGNFSLQERLDREFAGFNSDAAGPPQGTRIWRTFDHHPRFGNNYVGLRNRLALLTEAYSYLDFRDRVAATEAFVEETLKYSASHAREISRLIHRVDADTIRRADAEPPAQMGVEFQITALPKPVEILVGQVGKETNPRSGREMTVMIQNKFVPARMLNYGLFARSRSIPLPRAYIFPAEENLDPIIDILKAHGIAVEKVTEPATAELEAFVIDEVKHSERTYQGHRETTLKGHNQTTRMTFPAGSHLVRTAQPLANLVFYLLEPESDDGIVEWNLLDAHLAPGRTYPIYRITGKFDPASLRPGK